MSWKLFFQVVVLMLLAWGLVIGADMMTGNKWKVIGEHPVKINERTGEVRPLR